MFRQIGARVAASAVLCTVSMGILLLLQWLSWNGPEWLMRVSHVDDDGKRSLTLSVAVALPGIAAAIAILVSNVAVWSCDWVPDAN